MKLLTINTHSIIETGYKKKLEIFVDAVGKIQPDIIAMQEVNQVKIGSSFNHAEAVVSMLEKIGVNYYYKWLPIKLGYGMFDEGLAVLSKWPIEYSKSFFISEINDYYNWKTRKVLGIKTKGQWFYSVHMGWWKDEEEPFFNQWKKLLSKLDMTEKIWLMGDFNSEASVLREGYELVKKSGFYDSFSVAESKDNGITVGKKIDGWKTTDIDGMRIDYIFSNFKTRIKSSKVIFNGDYYDVVSDHFGVLIEVLEE